MTINLIKLNEKILQKIDRWSTLDENLNTAADLWVFSFEGKRFVTRIEFNKRDIVVDINTISNREIRINVINNQSEGRFWRFILSEDKIKLIQEFKMWESLLYWDTEDGLLCSNHEFD